MTTLTFQLGWLPPASVRGNSRAHWTAKARDTKALRESGHLHGLSKGADLMPKASIQYAFRHWRSIDLDNLVIGMKPFCDGIIDSGLLPDDDPEHLTLEAPTFERVKKGSEGVTVTLREIE